jgi:hypothetical protein
MRNLHHISGPIRTAVLLGAFVLLCVQGATAQSDLENVLKQYTETTVKGYIQPMADLFGANMHSGLYPSASVPQTGLSIRLTIVGMGAMVGDDQKNYSLALPPSFAQRTMQAPTVFGPKATVVRDPDTGLEFKPSDGIIDATLFPLAVPQLTVGHIFGTEATVRFITTPSIGSGKFPKTTLWGLGARHSVSQYIPESPVDIAVGFFYSSFTVGDIIDFSGVTIGAQAGKSFGPLDLFGGFSWEKSTMNLSFTPSAAGSPSVNLDLDGENTVRFTAGAGLNLSVIRLYADANFGAVTNFSAGLGFGF